MTIVAGGRVIRLGAAPSTAGSRSAAYRTTGKSRILPGRPGSGPGAVFSARVGPGAPVELTTMETATIEEVVVPAGHTGRVNRFVVTSNGPLSGTVRAGGAKNSVLKLMAACLLAEGRHVLTNVPRITDVDIMGELLGAMGVDVRRGETPDQLVVTTPADVVPEAPYELVEKMRASVVVLAPS